MGKPVAELASANAYREVVRQVEGMVNDKSVQDMARKFGLDVLNVTWEDTGRFKDSAVGPNISDVTIQVQQRVPGTDNFELTCMPVIRFPNYSDVTGDISPDLFFLLVGNHAGRPLEKVTLRHLLDNLRMYLSDPESWEATRWSMLAPERDSHVLVSAQACFLPIAKDGSVEFNPVIFNYQSEKGDPAVLSILATREGTSVTVIDNERDAFEAGQTWGQRLFFNENGQRASLTGQRKSEYVKSNAAKSKTRGNDSSGPDDGRNGLNMVLLIQVPLKQKAPRKRSPADMLFCAIFDPMEMERGGTEDAVIGHGAIEGPFTEIDGLPIERDDRFPIRVTVQFYKANSTGIVTEGDMKDIADQIRRVYDEADYVGSLVVDGNTNRRTEHSGPKIEPPDWWEDFWLRHFANTGRSREETLKMFERSVWRKLGRPDSGRHRAASGIRRQIGDGVEDMPGRQWKDFRGGNWSEDLGILLLKAICAVAAIPRQ